MMSFYYTLKYLVDKVFFPRRVGDPCRMPCRVRKEVWLEPREGAKIRKKLKHSPPYFQKKIQIKRGGGICAQSPIHGIVPKIQACSNLNWKCYNLIYHPLDFDKFAAQHLQSKPKLYLLKPK